MPRKRNPDNNYFNSDVENAVCVYLNSDNQKERETAFRIIYPALCKISEVWFNKLKVSYMDTDAIDMQMDCVAHIVEKMHMFNCKKGTKAFSYFTVMAKFYYMIHSNRNYNHIKRYIPMSEMGEQWDVLNNDADDISKSETAKLYYGFLSYCEYNFDAIFIPRFKPFARGVLDTLSNFEHIEEFKKKTILRSMYKRAKIENEYGKSIITKVINVMSSHLTLFSKRWKTGDESLELCVKNHLTQAEKEIIKNTIVPGINNNGTTKLAKEFGVDVNVVMDYLKST
jgi:hypothetical protein